MSGAFQDQEYLGSLFALEIDGVNVGYFTGCSGLGATSEVVTHQTTDTAGTLITKKRPGRISFDDITLKRGLSADTALTDWFQTVLDGAVERKSGSVIVYDTAMKEVGRWNFFEGWISKWSGSDLDTGSDDVMIEEVTISHERLERG